MGICPMPTISLGPANIEKMSRGIPLGDDDRIPWLISIREAMLEWDAQHRNVVLACSALKRSYRELLQIDSNVKLVYLKGSYELFRERLRSRKGHYAGEQIRAANSRISRSPRLPLRSTPQVPGTNRRGNPQATRAILRSAACWSRTLALQALAWVS